MMKNSSTTSLSSSGDVSAPAVNGEGGNDLEKALLTACAEGDTEKCQQVINQIHHKQESTANESIEELIGCAFARAASCNQVEVMQLLLQRNGNSISSSSATPANYSTSALLYGICRYENYFPPIRPDLRCCFAVRYIGHAAIMCVEHNAVNAMRFLIDAKLLEDVEIIRCFQLAKRNATSFDAPNPGAYRPMLMLLVTQFPFLLQREYSMNAGSTANGVEGKEDEDATRNMKALESSLLYEYKVNQISTWGGGC